MSAARRRLVALGAVVAAATTVVLVNSAPAGAAPSDADLARRWAPIHYQDSDSTDYDADYLSTVDFDGDWDAANNWEHEDDDPARLSGAMYYSVVETGSHWFVNYSFYHPRDWDDIPDPFDQLQHENDMEGVVVTVRKDGSTYGTIEAMVSVAHNDFYSYVPAGSGFTGGRENVDGPLIMQEYNGEQHPTTRQEAKGHGAYAWDGKEFPGGDGVTYVPSGTPETPSGGNDRSVGYQLVDVFAAGGLWARRDDPVTYASFGTFRGDNGKDNAANPPWGWDDQNDGDDLQRGLLATDPAYLFSSYFDGEGTFDLAYLRNAYRA